MRFALATATLVVCTWVYGAAPQSQARPQAAAAAKRAGKSSGAKKAQPHLSDAQLEAAIRARFAKSKSAANFTVRVQGGVAHIEGKTDVVQHKAAATRMARTAGAAAVDNRVQISEAARQRAAGKLAAGRRRAQVKRGESRGNR